MLGSTHQDYLRDRVEAAERFYTVELFGRTRWGWQRRDASGAIVACSETLFMDYVSCFCDAQARNR